MDNPAKQEILRRGMVSDFWQIITETLEDSIVKLREDQGSQDLRDLPADAYKLQNELLLAKIEYTKNLQQLPDNIIVYLNDAPDSQKNFDPYHKIEDFKN